MASLRVRFGRLARPAPPELAADAVRRGYSMVPEVEEANLPLTLRGVEVVPR